MLHRGYIVLIGFVGGLIGAINEFFDGAIKLAPWMSLSIFGASVFVAVLWAAYDLIADRDKTIADLRVGGGHQSTPTGVSDSRYEAVSGLIGGSLNVALELSKDGDWPLRDAWESRTRQIVSAAYGEGEAAHVFTPEMGERRVYTGIDMLNAPRPLSQQINRVRELLGRMPNLVVRSEFAPSDWAIFDPIAFRKDNARWVDRADATQDPWACPWCAFSNAWHVSECEGCGAERSESWVYRAPETASSAINSA